MCWIKDMWTGLRCSLGSITGRFQREHTIIFDGCLSSNSGAAAASGRASNLASHPTNQPPIPLLSHPSACLATHPPTQPTMNKGPTGINSSSNSNSYLAANYNKCNFSHMFSPEPRGKWRRRQPIRGSSSKFKNPVAALTQSKNY